MLREILSSRKRINGQARRWFASKKFDLFVFFNKENRLVEFQLCYDKLNNENVIAWSEKSGYTHALIDAGRNTSGRSSSPIFIANGCCDIGKLKKSFIEASLNLDDSLFEQIYKKLVGYKYR